MLVMDWQTKVFRKDLRTSTKFQNIHKLVALKHAAYHPGQKDQKHDTNCNLSDRVEEKCSNYSRIVEVVMIKSIVLLEEEAEDIVGSLLGMFSA